MSNSDCGPVIFHDMHLTQDSRVEIKGAEAGHIAKSRRLSPGDEITITDGKGICAAAVIQGISKSDCALVADILAVEEIFSQPVRRILAAAIPKGDRQSVLINMSTQLGMNEFWPLRCDRSVVRYQDKMRERWQRLIVSACKQSRQFNFPTIGAERSIDDVVSDRALQRMIVVGDIQGQSITHTKQQLTDGIQEILMVIGPEGGFSVREQELLEQKNVLKLRLSNQILRTETAAVSMLAAVNQLV